MVDLKRYVFFNYMHLMTDTEYAAYMFYGLEGKIAHASSPEIAAQMRSGMSQWLPPSPAAAALLRDGFEAFQRAVCTRILRECTDKVFLNYCPRCGALARRPQAKQCPHCFYSWHSGDGVTAELT